MPHIQRESKEVLVQETRTRLSLSSDEVTKIIEDHLNAAGYSIAHGSVKADIEIEWRGDPDWGIQRHPVGVFKGYSAEVDH